VWSSITLVRKAALPCSGRAAMTYDAFISYSHAADGQLAPALQRGLQRLAKPWNRRRALNVFRDETGLSTNPHLWSSVQAALDDSGWFILLASHEAAASEWVNKEVQWRSAISVRHRGGARRARLPDGI
jgi:hypothetical protein